RGVSDGAADAGRQGLPDLRGHQPGPASRDRAAAAAVIERPVPPALRAPLDPASQAWMHALPGAPYQENFQGLPVCRVKALETGRLPAPGVPPGGGVWVPAVTYLVDTPGGVVVI